LTRKLTEEEVISTLRANIGKKVRVWPINGGEPWLIRVDRLSSDGEDFFYYILEDPTLYDPTVLNECQFFDVSDVQEVPE